LPVATPGGRRIHSIVSPPTFIPDSCRSLVIFGGSFDPPHVAHVTLPKQVMHELGADLVAYVPAANPPLKARDVTAASHRLAMLRLALAGHDHAVVFTEEIDRAEAGQPSFTVDTLEQLHRRLGSVRMRLLIGCDQVLQFEQWKQRRRICELAEPVVMIRPPWTERKLLDALGSARARAEWADRLTAVVEIDVSSTEIRRRIAGGLPVSHLVAPDVERYIQAHGLYSDPPT